LLASIRAELIGRNFRECGCFTSLPARPDADTLCMSAPFTTALGVYSINVSRVVLGAASELAGLVSATLDPGDFDVVARSVLHANDMTASFVDGDGTLHFSRPPVPAAVGKNLNLPGAIFPSTWPAARSARCIRRLLDRGSERISPTTTCGPPICT
jgi:hypothetical protein